MSLQSYLQKGSPLKETGLFIQIRLSLKRRAMGQDTDNLTEYS